MAQALQSLRATQVSKLPMVNFNAATSELIGLLLPDLDPGPMSLQGRVKPQPMATALVRKSDGQMALEAIAADSSFIRDAMATGCFRKGSPIVDPVSREIMGYEMEMVESPLSLCP